MKKFTLLNTLFIAVAFALGFAASHYRTDDQAAQPPLKSQNQQEQVMKEDNPDTTPDLGAVFDAHVEHEFADKDVDATMRTMTAEPYVHNVPTANGGYGGEGVRKYYTEQFVGKMPKDTQVIPVSRTVGKDQVVDELILSFTHDIPIEFMLPGVPPTGKFVQLPHVVVMKFEGDKVAHEHIYWDQASLLVQVGLLDPELVPAAGASQAEKLIELIK
jgi:carboxymethylenebutenolidase